MRLTEAIVKWRSIRRYEEKPVPKEEIRAILKAAQRAPSWENTQPWHFIVVQEQDTKDLLCKVAFNQKHVARAPLVIACCGDIQAFSKEQQRAALLSLKGADGVTITEDIVDKILLTNPAFSPYLLGKNIVLARVFEQLGIAVSFMCLEAASLGLGCCIVGAFGNRVTREVPELAEEARKKLNLPDSLWLLTLLTVGYPAEDPRPRPRKALEEIASLERYGRVLPCP